MIKALIQGAQMTYNLKDEMAKAARVTIYGSIDLANEQRGYIRANSSPKAANIAIARLKQLSEGFEASKGIPANTKITGLHFKKAINDFSETRDALRRSGNNDGAELANQAFSILVQAYMDSTNDRDVYRAMPEETILDLNSLG